MRAAGSLHFASVVARPTRSSSSVRACHCYCRNGDRDYAVVKRVAYRGGSSAAESALKRKLNSADCVLHGP